MVMEARRSVDAHPYRSASPRATTAVDHTSITFSPSTSQRMRVPVGDHVIEASPDQRTLFLKRGKTTEQRLDLPHRATAVAIDSSGTRCAILSRSQEVQFWDMKSSRKLHASRPLQILAKGVDALAAMLPLFGASTPRMALSHARGEHQGPAREHPAGFLPSGRFFSAPKALASIYDANGAYQHGLVIEGGRRIARLSEDWDGSLLVHDSEGRLYDRTGNALSAQKRGQL